MDFKSFSPAAKKKQQTTKSKKKQTKITSFSRQRLPYFWAGLQPVTSWSEQVELLSSPSINNGPGDDDAFALLQYWSGANWNDGDDDDDDDDDDSGGGVDDDDDDDDDDDVSSDDDDDDAGGGGGDDDDE